MKTNKKIHYYLKLRIPMCHRQFFRRISQNREYIQSPCNDKKNHFILHFTNGIHIIIHNKVVLYLHEYKYE